MSNLNGAETPLEAAKALCQGNPGALRVLCAMAKTGEMNYYRILDDLGIVGPRIWKLYKDCCKEDLNIMLVVLTATQGGSISTVDLYHAIDHYGEGLNIEAAKKTFYATKSKLFDERLI